LLEMTYFTKSATFEGKLYKKGKINKAWKERWFVLDENEQKMEYYATKEDAAQHTHLCGTIDISVIARVEVISNVNQIKLSETELLRQNKTILSKFMVENNKTRSDRSYSFQLVTKERTFMFAAADSASYIAWLNELLRVIYGGIVYEGLLKKLGGKNKSWKSRYFTLNKYKQMKYYVDKTRTEFLGLIDLNLCILITNGKSYGVNLKWTIEIQTPQRIWVICAIDKQQKYEWEKMVKAVRWEKLSDEEINKLIQQNLWKHHAEDIKAMQANGGSLDNNPQGRNARAKTNIFGDASGRMAKGMGSKSVSPVANNNGGGMDDQMLKLQEQMMMNNLMLANHLQAMHASMNNNASMYNMQSMPNMQQAAAMQQMQQASAMNFQQGSMMNFNQMQQPNNFGFGSSANFNQYAAAQQQPHHLGVHSNAMEQLQQSQSAMSFSAPSSLEKNKKKNNQNQTSYSRDDNIYKMYQAQVQHSVMNDSDDDEKVKQQHEGPGGGGGGDEDDNNNVPNPPDPPNNNNPKQQQQQEQNNNNNNYNVDENGLRVEKVNDHWDAALIGKTLRAITESGNRVCRATVSNDKQWYNIFSAMITENQVQYHWRIKINHYNSDWVLIIGIMDTCYVDEYVQHNNNKSALNKHYFAKSKYGYGIDANGDLKNGGKSGGKYCNAFKNGDVVDVYFDMKQFVLWYGLNGKEYGVACKVHESFYKCCVAMFGPKHCVEMVSCDTYFYPQ